MAAPTPFRDWVRPFAVTMALAGLVSAGVAGGGRVFPLVVLLTAAVLFGLLLRMFPERTDFAFGTAIVFAAYACLFSVIGRSAVPDVGWVAEAGAFLLPLACFLAAVRLRGTALLDAPGGDGDFAGEHVWRTGRWIGLMALVAAAGLSLPLNRLTGQGQGTVLVALMGVVGALVIWAVRDVVRSLVDVALLLGDLTRRINTLAVPVATFVALYVLVTIVFACLYRIADRLSLQPLFQGASGTLRLEFTDALHFSVATISTVGYGDIRPQDDGVRLLAAAEVMAGQVLLLFGFYEIMNSRRVNRALERAGGGAEDAAGDDGAEAADEGDAAGPRGGRERGSRQGPDAG